MKTASPALNGLYTPNVVIKSLDIDVTIDALDDMTHEKMHFEITRVSIENVNNEGWIAFFTYFKEPLNGTTIAWSWNPGAVMLCGETAIDTTSNETMFRSFQEITDFKNQIPCRI